MIIPYVMDQNQAQRRPCREKKTQKNRYIKKGKKWRKKSVYNFCLFVCFCSKLPRMPQMKTNLRMGSDGLTSSEIVVLYINILYTPTHTPLKITPQTITQMKTSACGTSPWSETCGKKKKIPAATERPYHTINLMTKLKSNPVRCVRDCTLKWWPGAQSLFHNSCPGQSSAENRLFVPLEDTLSSQALRTWGMDLSHDACFWRECSEEE